jgi:hypothetical protein
MYGLTRLNWSLPEDSMIFHAECHLIEELEQEEHDRQVEGGRNRSAHAPESRNRTLVR